MSLTLLIARHGNTFAEGETPRRIGCGTDMELAPSGRMQAERLAAHLHNNELVPRLMFISTLQRTRQMGQIINAHNDWDIHMTVLTALDEIDYGEDENATEAHVLARIGQPALDAWEKDAIPPDGWHANPEKIRQGWKNLAHYLIEHEQEGIFLAITSNGIARFAPCLLEAEAAFQSTHMIKMATGALSSFHYDNGLWHCDSWNIRP